MAWTVEYTDTSKKQLRKLDRQMARPILNYMDERVAQQDAPHQIGKTRTGPLGGLWRYRVELEF